MLSLLVTRRLLSSVTLKLNKASALPIRIAASQLLPEAFGTHKVNCRVCDKNSKLCLKSRDLRLIWLPPGSSVGTHT